jgi:carbon monoxide dehydrogenase subunit G
MQIADTFRVSTPLDETWRVLLDIEGIAPCLPGAQLQEVEGNEYRGVVKVKVGPITAQYKGTATLVEADEAGQGNAKASIIVTMNDEAGGTRVDVVTDLSITGKVAQFGRGVLDDVSAKLLRQFVENLERDVLTNTGAPAPADLEVDTPPAVATPTHTNGVTATPTGPRRIDSPEAEPIDLLEAAGGSAARRLVPVAVGVVVLFLLWRLLRRRA